jgi:hypothetical protein
MKLVHTYTVLFCYSDCSVNFNVSFLLYTVYWHAATTFKPMLIFPNNGDDLPSTLRKVITEGADSPMTTVGIIGRGNLTSLANSLADEALFEGREEGIYNKYPVEIHASYQRSTATLYLVIVSVYDGQGLDCEFLPSLSHSTIMSN